MHTYILFREERGKWGSLPLLLIATVACFIRYFHKVPAEAPLLELKASYGLAEPAPFELPPLIEQFSPEVYATFDLTKGAKSDKVPQLASMFTPNKSWAAIQKTK